MEETVDQRSWWQRNWKWALPTGGCLTIVIIGIVLLGYGAYKVADTLSEETNVFGFIKVITTVQKNAEVAEALGKPIEIRANDYDPERDTNRLNLEIDLEGQKSDGTLRVIATKTEDGWDYELFTVTVEDTGEVIDLIDDVND